MTITKWMDDCSKQNGLTIFNSVFKLYNTKLILLTTQISLLTGKTFQLKVIVVNTQ